MSLTETTAPAAEPLVTPPTIAPTIEGGISTSQAARELAQRRWAKRNEEQATPAASPTEFNAQARAAMAEPPAPELPSQEESAAPEEVPGDQTQATEPAELPPIEPPRSWTKEEQDEFRTYPREAQEKIARREQDRDRALRQRQNEAAEARKAVEAEQAAATQKRQEYEAALAQAVQLAQQQAAGEFADLRSWDDVQRLASEDPVRFLKWQAHQQKMQALAVEQQAVQQRQQQELFQKWNTYAAEQERLFAEKVPEINDKDKGQKLREAAVGALRDTGFTNQELDALWNGQASITLRDHRMQLLIHDAVKYRTAKAITAQPQPAKPVPPVQRPGAAQPRGAAGEASIQALSQKLDQTGTAKDAAALRVARREAARR